MTAKDPELLGNQQQMSVDGLDGDKKGNGDLSGCPFHARDQEDFHLPLVDHGGGSMRSEGTVHTGRISRILPGHRPLTDRAASQSNQFLPVADLLRRRDATIRAKVPSPKRA